MDSCRRVKPVSEGDLLWEPSAAFSAASQMAIFRDWLKDELGLSFDNYEALWHWSVDNPVLFWDSIWHYFDIQSSVPVTEIRALDSSGRAQWFVGSRTNYAEHVLRHEARAAPEAPALISFSEARSETTVSWAQLGQSVRKAATALRNMGIEPGDRVISYMPNVPEAVIAMLATAAIGGTWAAASPEFGPELAIERFDQIQPKLAFMADGYRFAGKDIDRRDYCRRIVDQLACVEHVIWLDHLGLGSPRFERARSTLFGTLVAGDPIAADDFQYERVPHDHPLWILFSSGTTGLPKAIVHGHAGIIAEHLKLMTFHMNLAPGDRNFFFTTTGWMMWNLVVSSLITGASAVLYDGSPLHPTSEILWEIAAKSRTTLIGASPSLIQRMQEEEIIPSTKHDLSAMQMILLGGAPSTPETFQWCYDSLKPDLWVTSQSGGTEICSGFVGAVPWRSVYAGEIQGRCLGMNVHAWNDAGDEVIDEEGELVVTSPSPAMPLRLWRDDGNRRYDDSYYSYYPGVWRHGDRIKFNGRGGCYIKGRSDSTLNRYGVRIGTAEIYSVVKAIEGVRDCLAVCCETRDGSHFLPLFVTLDSASELDATMQKKIRDELRSRASPRHVPDEVHAVPGIPYTQTGKILEVPVRKILMGVPVTDALSRDTVSNPEVLDWFTSFGEDLRTRLDFEI